MKTAIYAPIFNDYGRPHRLVELAVAAERAGYDGFFVWDHLAIEPEGRLEVVDAMTTLAAIAQMTRRIRLGTMITPLARRRPWKLAKELMTLDHLSEGRVTLGVGLGEPAAVEFAAFGEDPSPAGRAARLDEGLSVLAPLMRGECVTHRGRFYELTAAQLAPLPLQPGGIPIWVAAALPATAGLRRAARWDGVFPIKIPEAIQAGTIAHADWSEWWLCPEELRGAVARVAALRPDMSAYDVVACGRAQGDGRMLDDYAAAGATWWFEWIDDAPGSFEATLAATARGAPVARR